MVKYCKLDSTELLLEVGQFVFPDPDAPSFLQLSQTVKKIFLLPVHELPTYVSGSHLEELCQ